MKPFYEIGDIYYLPVRTYVIMIYFISCESSQSHVPSLHFSTYLLLLRLHLYFRIILFLNIWIHIDEMQKKKMLNVLT